MRRFFVGVLALAVAASAPGMVFERFLSPDRPTDRAIMSYMELEKAGKATSSDLANLGVLILEKGFPRDAEHYLRKALKLDKDNYEAAYRLGLVLQRQGHDLKATHYYKRTLKARPGYAQARFMLALAEERCGLRDAAIADYVRAYRHAPNLANPDLNPLVYDSHLQTEAALKYYREKVVASTLKVDPIDPAAVRQMMQIRAAHEGPQAAQSTPQPPSSPPAQPKPPAHGGSRLAPPQPTPTPQP
jgi:tetratricopeptide (TPR) repeat protein